jgi:hypothetical protein
MTAIVTLPDFCRTATATATNASTTLPAAEKPSSRPGTIADLIEEKVEVPLYEFLTTVLSLLADWRSQLQSLQQYQPGSSPSIASAGDYTDDGQSQSQTQSQTQSQSQLYSQGSEESAVYSDVNPTASIANGHHYGSCEDEVRCSLAVV